MVRISNGYDREVRILKRIISRHKASKGKALLDAGCGTGGHLRSLANDFDCTGLDLYEGMLRVARKNVPNATFVRASMTDFCLGRKFDVILCMYGAIGLVRTYRNLGRTVRNFSNHLRKGGIVILEDDLFSDSKSPSPYMNLLTAEAGDTKIAKVEYYRRRGNVLIEREDYLIAERGKGIRHYADLQYAGMFELSKTMRIFERAGLEPKSLNGSLYRGRGLLLGIKRT
jgi:dTDP-3-amino-3,6-dideoxy-alpha-D-glucopyranose N,N-dimethyltransferase/dTDP-3-amino-3,4,6-trideoxy-alpha-D-glucopyranose N,N-dimethyltransferase/N-methyltransferase